MNIIGIVQIGIVILFLLFLLFLLYIKNIKTKYNGAYFLPTKQSQIDTIIKFLGNNNNNNIEITDLGSGTGSLILKLAKQGFRVTGYEISYILYIISIISLRINGIHENVKVFNRNFWKEDLSKYNVVIVYGIGYMMEDLESKLLMELKKGSVIISVRFPLVSSHYKEVENGVYLYKI